MLQFRDGGATRREKTWREIRYRNVTPLGCGPRPVLQRECYAQLQPTPRAGNFRASARRARQWTEPEPQGRPWGRGREYPGVVVEVVDGEGRVPGEATD